MDKEDLALLQDDRIPEAVRASLATAMMERSKRETDQALELRKLQFARQKARWNTPLVVALTGVITLGATFVFDAFRIGLGSRAAEHQAEVVTENTVTLAQLRAEIAASEARLSQSLAERQTKTEAELAALAEERAFQFNLVQEQLANRVDQKERANVLLFLARSGILSTLNVDYLESLAEQELEAPEGQSRIPTFNPAEPALDWSDLGASANLRYATVGAAVARLDLRSAAGLSPCTGVFVSQRYVLTADYCQFDGLAESLAILGYRDRGDVMATTSIPLEPVFEAEQEGRFAVFRVAGGEIRGSLPDIAPEARLVEGLPLVMIHHPMGGRARVSLCNVQEVRDTDFLHDCDSLPGSGGAPLFTATDLRIVGLHHSKLSHRTETEAQVNTATRLTPADIAAFLP